MTRKYGKKLALALTFALSCTQLFAQNSSAENSIADIAVDSVVTVLLAADGQANAVGSGLIVRADGYIMTPYSLVKGAREIQIRLRNGEIYDKAEVVSTDERRNIAILHVNAVGLRYIPNGTTEETQVGSRMFVLTNPAGQVAIKGGMVLNSVQMADSIPGAGKGYRVMQFDTGGGTSAIGGLLLDERGRSLGIITTTPDVKGQNIAVPLSSLVGLIRSVPLNRGQSVGSASIPTSYPAPSQTPYPIPQSSVLVPQRGVTPLAAKGPGSVVVKPGSIPEVLAASKTIHVESRTISFKPEQLVNELSKRREIPEWGLSFVEERALADLILEIDHVLLTWKYTFKVYSQRLGTIVATGSVIILDGNVGAPAMAARVISKLKTARGEDKKTPNVTEKEVKKEAEKNKATN
jgi:S1-C subfamily serine protease